MSDMKEYKKRSLEIKKEFEKYKGSIWIDKYKDNFGLEIKLGNTDRAIYFILVDGQISIGQDGKSFISSLGEISYKVFDGKIVEDGE